MKFKDYDGELCELFQHDNSSRAIQSLQPVETKSMVKEEGTNHNGIRKRGKIFTAFIFLSGSLICVSFGTMLGWPSPTYPSLLRDDANIFITIDQSAMIAGMLMNGFVVSTPFAGSECLGSKFGVLLSAAFQFSGWLLIIGASDVLGLCISRILIGLGGGYGMGKFRNYLKETSEKEESLLLQKLLPLFICLGVLISFSVGPWVSYNTLAIINAIIPGLCFLTFIIVPDTPYHLFKKEKFNTNISVLQNLQGKQSVQNEIENIKNCEENKLKNRSIFQILRKSSTRKSFLVLTFLMTIQQFSGGPSLIVYSEIIFTEFRCIYPSICAIIYALSFLLSTGIGIRYVSEFERKPILLLSCVGIIFTSASHAAYLYLQPENNYYTIIPFITMIMYGFFHTAGIATVTNLMVADIFPLDCRYTMMCFWNMYTAELAVIITKIFQVFMARYDMYVGFCLYTSVSTFGFIVILVFLSEPKRRLERNSLI